jgi:hypothetical protein
VRHTVAAIQRMRRDIERWVREPSRQRLRERNFRINDCTGLQLLEVAFDVMNGIEGASILTLHILQATLELGVKLHPSIVAQELRCWNKFGINHQERDDVGFV